MKVEDKSQFFGKLIKSEKINISYCIIFIIIKTPACLPFKVKVISKHSCN